MKRLALLVLIPLCAVASPETHETEKAAAIIIRNWIYEHEKTEAFCSENPQGVFAFEYRDREIKVNCEVRNAWIRLPEAKR